MILYTTLSGKYRITISTILLLSSLSTQADNTSSAQAAQSDGPAVIQINKASAAFGSGIATAGDVNGDGYDDIIVGAGMFSGTYTNEGAAFLYLGSATGLDTTPSWQITGGQNAATLGQSVATAGDINGDGYDDILVSAPLYDVAGQTNAGIVYIFTGSAAGLSSTPAFQLSLGKATTRFGASIAGADVNGDGYSDIVIGAYVDDGQTGNDGIYIYHGGLSGPSSIPTATLRYSQPNTYFGNAVATAGDINADGYDDILVGAPYYDGDKVNEGAVLLYAGSPAGIQTTPLQQFKSNQPGTLFGLSISTAGDVNNDGYDDIVIGGYGTEQDGAVWIYQGSDTGMQLATVLKSNQAGALFGFSVSLAGDVNNDSFSDIIVGAPMYTHNEVNEGAVLLYLGGPSGITDIPARIHESNSIQAEYGNRVTSPGDNNGDGYDDYLVGAFKYTQGEYREGAVFFYPGGTGTLPIHLLTFSGHADGCNAVLNWEAGTEDNLTHYTVEASTDGTHFTPVDNIPRNATGEYTCTTHQQIPRTYYRITGADINGQLSHSRLTLVQTKCVESSQDASATLYPNPANSKVLISNLTRAETLRITVYDQLRPVVVQYTVQPFSPVELDVSLLPAGIYTVQIQQESISIIRKLIINH